MLYAYGAIPPVAFTVMLPPLGAVQDAEVKLSVLLTTISNGLPYSIIGVLKPATNNFLFCMLMPAGTERGAKVIVSNNTLMGAISITQLVPPLVVLNNVLPAVT